MNENLYLQYGCGMSAPNEWENYDASPTLKFERLPLIGKFYTRNYSRFPSNVVHGNIVNGLPVENACYYGVYCSHVLEHLSLQDFRLALENTNKILRPGGVFRLVVPDLKYFVNEYTASDSSHAAFDFLKRTSLGREKRAEGILEFFVEWLGNRHHLWMWDFESIKNELNIAGFRNVRRAFLGDSDDNMFEFVEDPSRWLNCLGVECTKV